ncbi:armadillo-type fold protein [Tanacetum coccineum]|uniref:Armadillo-type fold protein n=1 Tax=Tanacetum coccineum TaxID=301880 RepID=A0ABQ5JDN4_9ASTR
MRIVTLSVSSGSHIDTYSHAGAWSWGQTQGEANTPFFLILKDSKGYSIGILKDSSLHSRYKNLLRQCVKMANTDVELEQQLKEVGKKLLHPPDVVDELLPVLDVNAKILQVERLLSKVDQSPKKTMLDALKPSMKALIQDDLLRHSDVDVKVAVASCISEITRITALDAPYDDDQMRDVFREDVLKKSAEKLNPYLMSALTALCDLLDTYFEIVTRVCEGTTAAMKRDDENDSGQQLADKSKQAKGSQDETQQADDNKITIASLDHVDQVDKEEPCPQEEVNVDPIDGSPKSVMNTDDKLAKSESKPEPTPKNGEKKSDTNIDSAEPSDSSHVEGKKEAEKLESEDEKDNDVKESAISAPFQSETEKDNDDVQVSSPKAIESKSATANVSSPSQSDSLPDASRIKKAARSKRKQVPQQDEIDTENAASPSKSETPLDESRSKKAERSKNKDLDQEENTPLVDVKAPEISSDSDVKPQKRAGKMAVVAKKVKSPATIDSSEDDEAASDSDKEPPLKISKKLEPVNSGRKSKQWGKKAVVTKEVKLPDTIDSSEDDEAASDSDEEPQLKVSKKLEPVNSGSKSKQSSKKAVVTKEVKLPDTIDSSEDDEAASDSDDEPPRKVSKKLEPVNSGSKSKQSGKKAVVTKEVELPATVDSSEDGAASSSDDELSPKISKKLEPVNSGSKSKQPEAKNKLVRRSKQSAKKRRQCFQISEPLKSVKKVEKRKRTVEEEDSDSDAKPLKLSAKKGNASTSGDVKSSSKKKDDGQKRASGKNVIKKDEAKTLSSDDEMDVSPKSAKKPAKGEGNLKDTSGTSSKRKRTPVKDKESDTIKYDESLVGKKVKVWWPEDKMYYEGVIESFDAAKKKHKVSYVDGDEENLYLRNQRWAIIQNFSVRDKDEIAEYESEEASPEVHKKKKSKADPAPSASQEKNKDSSKKCVSLSSTLSSLSKASGSKDNKPKAGKSKEAEATPKTSTKTKQETSKSVNRSKGKTPQSGSKSNGPNKAKEPESAVKTPEKGGSKKRKK